MIDENNVLAPFAEKHAIEALPSPAERNKPKKSGAANRRDVARHRARQAALEGRELILSEKEIKKQREATDALFGKVLAKLTPQQRAELETETEDLPTLKEINDLMHRNVLLCELECFADPQCRPDIVSELYASFVSKHSVARDLTFPRASYADLPYRGWMAENGNFFFAIKNDAGETLVEFNPDSPIQFSVDRFFDAVRAYKRWRTKNPPTVEPAEKQKRGRLKKEPHPKETLLPAVVASCTI